MRIVISGAAGFIGSHLADLLLSQDHEVIGIDNFITGKERNIAQLQTNRSFTMLRQDVCEPVRIDGPIDRVYHLASPASPVSYEKHRIATMQANSAGTWNLLDLAVAKNARFLVASTSEIYGDPAQVPQREEYWGNVNPIGLRSIYEEAKRFSEACTMAFHRERNADTRIIRIFSCFGPRMDLYDGRMITNFVRQALAGESLTVHGDGTQTRSIIYIDDLLRGMIGTMEEADFHEPINLGNPEEVSVVQVAKEIVNLVPGTKSKIVFQPSLDYDPKTRKPDISRARQILGWTPKVPRKEGLAKVVEYFASDNVKR